MSRSICKNNGKITYEDRKKGIMCDLYTGIWEENKQYYLKSDMLKMSGRVFNASDENEEQGKIFAISGRFLPDPLYKNIGKWSSPTAPTTYIYIISKTIGGKTYYKVGEGGKGESKGVGRLGDAQTYLIPGLEDAGYKVHFVFFFRKNLTVNSKYIGLHIEHNIHKVLRAYFQPINIAYPNNTPSEWYLLNTKNEEIFFLGFVFDIIGCYDHPQTKPFVIWKYDKNGRSNVSLPPGIIQRMRLNKTYEEIAEKLKEFNLRKKHRAIGLIVDKNNTEIYEEHLNIVRRFFGFSVRENLRTKPFKLVFDNYHFDLVDFRSYNSTVVEKYSKYYAILIPSNLNHAQTFFDKKGIVMILSDVSEVLVRMKDFLRLYKEYYVSNTDSWQLQSMYDFYNSTQYEKNIECVEPVTEQIPSWIYSLSVQLYWARKMTNDKDWKRHNDFSIDDEDKEAMKQWEVYGYDEEDGVRIKRYQLDSDGRKVDGTEEDVDAIRVMKLLDIYKPKTVNKRMLQKKRVILKSATIKSENGEMITYKPGDVVEICDDYFLFYDIHGEPDGLPHKDWSKYKIDFIYKNTKYDEDFMNPWLEVTYSGIKYEIVANEYIHKKIRKLSSSPSTEPILKKGQIIHIAKNNAKNIFSNSSWWEHDHYVIVDSIDRSSDSYKISTFAPFASIETVEMDVLHKNVKDEPIEDATLERYKKGLLFKIMPISQIDGHKPQTATSHSDLLLRRNPKYRVIYEDSNAEEMGISVLQDILLVKEAFPGKVASYWQSKTKKRNKSTRKTRKIHKHANSKLYGFETLNSNIDRAKTNWVDHHNVNIKNVKSLKPAYEYKVYNPDGSLTPFCVGDLFVLRQHKTLKKGYITNYYYDKDKDTMTYGVFFSSEDNEAKGSVYPEYTAPELVELIKEGNTIPFLESMDDKVFGKMRRRYSKMIA